MSDTHLEEIKYTFSQPCNTNGSTGRSEEFEELKIIVESCISSIHTDGGFLTIRTAGWSVNNAEELHQILSLIERGIPSKIKK